MADPRPNILFLFPDQWRGDSLSAYDHPVALTPFLDALAHRGVAFRNAYSNCPVCIPARACLVTGQTPHAVGRFAYRDGVEWTYRPTLMHLLRDGGYQTLLAGKTHFHPPRAHLGFEQLQLYDNQRHHPGFESDYDRWLRDRTGGQIEDSAQQLNSNSMIVQPWTHDESLHANTWTVTAAIDMLERRDPTRPFFLQMNFHRPHPPLDPPIEFFERFADVELPPVPMGDWVTWADQPEPRVDQYKGRIDPRLLDRARRGYFAQLAHLDFQIGRLLRWLQLRGQESNTVVVFSSDHGEHLGDHALYRKSTFLQGSAGVPLIIRPTHGTPFTPGRRDQPAALHDLMPTFLEMAGVDVPTSVEGRSLAPLLADPDAPWRTHVHLEMFGSAIGAWQCVTDGRWKYAWLTRGGEEFLFDLRNDPQECRNLAGDPVHAATLELWRRRLIDELARRPEDGLTDGQKLTPGNAPPAVRPWVLEAAEAAEAARG